MKRAFLIVLDSAGCGGAPDAAHHFNGEHPDTGANTLGHVSLWRSARGKPLLVPLLDALGLGRAITLASGLVPPGLSRAKPKGRWGAATESSRGKDTVSGHWELAGVPVAWAWTYFPKQIPAFDKELVNRVCALAGTKGILGTCHAAGAEIIKRLGAEHLTTLRPICYTSADSVFQIAAPEGAFGLQRLYALCAALAPYLHERRVGRVIARPFTGTPGDFVRTASRRDFAMPPPKPTLLDWAYAAGRTVHAVGKIGDVFAHRGTSQNHKGPNDKALLQHLVRLGAVAEPGSLTLVNLVQFDTHFGHRTDPEGYARALEWFDGALGQFLAHLRPGDLTIITADHGNDPTFFGTDHTRERVPVLMHGVGEGEIGLVAMVVVAATIADHLDLPEKGPGRSFL